MKKHWLLLAGLIFCAGMAHSQTKPVSFSLNALTYSNPEEARTIAEAALTEALGQGKYQLLDHRASERADYRIIIVDNDNSQLTNVIQNSTEQNRVIMMDINNPFYSKTLVSYIRLFVQPEVRVLPEPVWLADFSISNIRSIDVGFGGQYLTPSAVEKDIAGNLLVAVSRGVLVFDQNLVLKDFIGKALFESGNQMFAYNMRVSPGGVLYTWSSSPAEYYVKGPHDSNFLRRRVPLANLTGFDVLPDGTAAGSMIGQRNFRILERGTVQTVNTGNDFVPMGFGTDALGRIYLYDGQSFSLRVFTREGNYSDLVVLEGGNDMVNMLLRVMPDGSSIFKGAEHLLSYSNTGRARWMINASRVPSGINTMAVTGVFEDTESGYLYVADILGRKLMQFKVPGFALTERDKAILSARAAGELEGLMSLARLQESLGALDLAIATYEELLEYRPADVAARASLERLRARLFFDVAQSQVADMKRSLLDFGTETARPIYQKAMASFEQAVAADPGNQDIRAAMAEARRIFAENERDQARRFSLKVEDWSFPDLFPSLIQTYRSSPPGVLVVKNESNTPIRNLKVSVDLRYYTDFPTEAEGPATLAPGATARLPLGLVLNQRALEVQEDMPLQIQVTLKFEASGQVQEQQINRPVNLLRRSALVWDDARKLAAFVTPREQTIQNFSLTAINNSWSQPEGWNIPLYRAFLITQHLTGMGFNYVPDPASPITSVLGQSTVVDSVRPAFSTLQLKAGDCDDTSALLSSLLEAAGIATAIITTPGHVLIAMDTGEPEENAWLFTSGDLKPLLRSGRVWIPLETTVLGKGFLEVWREGSKLVQAHQPRSEMGFYALSAAREHFPALPLRSGFDRLPMPSFAEIRESSQQVRESLASLLDAGIVSTIRAGREGANARGRHRSLLQEASLHVRYGRPSSAEPLIRQVLREDGRNLAAHVALGQLLLGTERITEAVTAAEAGFRLHPGSVYLRLLLARSYEAQGNRSKALEHWNIVVRDAPALASLYPHLAAMVNTTSRASAAQDRGPDVFLLE